MHLGKKRDGPFLLKKSEIARYFGLIENDWLGKRVRITEKGINYFESKTYKEKMEIILESLMKDSFGRNKWGVKNSNSDLNPPNLFLHTINLTKSLSVKEFAYIIYLIHDENIPFNDAIKKLLEFIPEKFNSIPTHLLKKYTDIKFRVFFENLGLIYKVSQRYYLSNDLEDIINHERIYKNLLNTTNSSIILGEKLSDFEYIINNSNIIEGSNNRKPIIGSGKSSTRYKTDNKIKNYVNKINNYKCTLNKEHKTFKKENGEFYIESHHIIPMNAQKYYLDVNLDNSDNLAPVCPACHKELHHISFKERKKLVYKLYKPKIDALSKRNINIPFEEVFKYYLNTK